jgi:hypothetical protein
MVTALRRPTKKTNSSSFKRTVVGMRREELLNEWTQHALTEHEYAQYSVNGVAAVLNCCGCGDFVQQLWKSETWT